jgi:hypothetical protein
MNSPVIKMRLLAALCLIAMLLVVALVYDQANAETFQTGEQYMYVSVSHGSSLKLHREPNTTSFTCSYKYRGDKLLVRSISPDGWAAVGSDPYYCFAEYLSIEPPTEKQGRIVSNGRVALRRSPNGERVRWLQNGSSITISSTCTDAGEKWYITDKDLYVKAEFVKMESGKE